MMFPTCSHACLLPLDLQVHLCVCVPCSATEQLHVVNKMYDACMLAVALVGVICPTSPDD